MATSTTKPPALNLRGNGDLMLVEDGEQDLLIGKYDKKTGYLEFESEAFSRKWYKQATACIGTVENGTKPSGMAVNRMGVKGRKQDDLSKAPKKPKPDPSLGDATPAIVEWYFRYAPEEAYIRYRVFRDAAGEPIRRKVRRKWTAIVDDRQGNTDLMQMNEGRGSQVGTKKWENGPIQRISEFETLDNQIVALRGTCLTFTPNEVVGGFALGDQYEDYDPSELAENDPDSKEA